MSEIEEIKAMLQTLSAKLEKLEGGTVPPPPKGSKKNPPQNHGSITAGFSDVDVDNDFIVNNNLTKAETNVGGIPVTEGRARTNEFVDDGSEASDIETPLVKPTERKRPPAKKIDVTCQKCGKSEGIYEKYKKETHTCDQCIIRRRQ